MSLWRKMGVAALLVACCPCGFSRAGVYVGIGVPGPYYYRRPYYRYPYYRPWYGYGGVYVAPPPVVIQQPPVVQQPVVVQPSYSPAAPPSQAPAPLPMPSPSPTVANAPGYSNVTPAGAVANAEAEIDSALQQLRSGDEKARADAVVRLGRLRAERAVGPIVKALNSDGSPVVREAAARGLGLIGSPSALSALQYAAQADNDREVRHSASFAAETIRGNLRR